MGSRNSSAVAAQGPPHFLLPGLSLRADVSRERPTVQLHGYGMSEGWKKSCWHIWGVWMSFCHIFGNCADQWPLSHFLVKNIQRISFSCSCCYHEECEISYNIWKYHWDEGVFLICPPNNLCFKFFYFCNLQKWLLSLQNLKKKKHFPSFYLFFWECARFFRKDVSCQFQRKKILLAEHQPLLSEPAGPFQHVDSLEGEKRERYCQQLSSCEMQGTAIFLTNKWRTVLVYQERSRSTQYALIHRYLLDISHCNKC